MTRAEIMSEYRVVDGVIRSPGKFEGEPVWAPHAWELALDGAGDDEDCDCEAPEDYDHCNCPTVSVLYPLTEDYAEFPELADVAVIRIWERDDGFVCTETFETRAAYDAALKGGR